MLRQDDFIGLDTALEIVCNWSIKPEYDRCIRGQVLAWRDKIEGKVGDDRIRHLQRIIGFALDRSKPIHYRLQRIRSVYKSNRADIFWMPNAFALGAPAAVARTLTAAAETGLRPGDLLMLCREHIHRTAHGRRIAIWTKKRKRLAPLPVTRCMAQVLDAMPEAQARIRVNQSGEPYQHEYYLGDAVSAWRDKLKIRKEIRLYDSRGTAAEYWRGHEGNSDPHGVVGEARRRGDREICGALTQA